MSAQTNKTKIILLIPYKSYKILATGFHITISFLMVHARRPRFCHNTLKLQYSDILLHLSVDYLTSTVFYILPRSLKVNVVVVF